MEGRTFDQDRLVLGEVNAVDEFGQFPSDRLLAFEEFRCFSEVRRVDERGKIKSSLLPPIRLRLRNRPRLIRVLELLKDCG